MSMERWLACADERWRDDVEMAARSMEPASRCTFVDEADSFREKARTEGSSYLGAIVGRRDAGVTDVNLAAAVVEDGGTPRVALVRRGASGSLRSRALRAGIDLVVDPEVLQGVDSGERKDMDGGPSTSSPESTTLRESVTHSPDDDASGAPILTFCSGRGGVGKTTLVSAAAVVAAGWGMRVGVVDLDLSCGNLFSSFGLARGCDLARLASTGLEVVDDMASVGVRACEGVTLWGPCDLPEMAEVAMPLAAKIVRCVAGIVDLVLVDTSTTFTDAVAQAAQLSDRLALVSDGGRGSSAALARMGGLSVRLGVERTRIVRIENRVNPRAKLDLSSNRAEVGLEAARIFRASEGGEEVSDYLASGEVTELVEIGSDFTDSVGTLLAQILSELGRLPECQEAERALARGMQRRRIGLFRSKREVV